MAGLKIAAVFMNLRGRWIEKHLLIPFHTSTLQQVTTVV